MLSNGVYDLLIGSDDNYMWFAFNGLSIYDGQSVVSYNFKQGLPKEPINKLFEDSKGNIWMGSGANKREVKWNNGK